MPVSEKSSNLKKLKRIIKGTLWSVIIAYIAVIMIIHIPSVQSWLGKQVGGIIADKLNTKVSVGRVYLGFLNRIIIDDLELYDQKSELMLRSTRVAAKIEYSKLISNKRIYISSAQVFGLRGVFYKKDRHTAANFQFVLDSLASKDKSKKSDIELSINSLIIRHGAIKYDRYDIAPTPSRINPAHIDVKDISAHLIIPYYTADSLEASIKTLSFNEASGLRLKKLKFNVSLNKNTAELDGFELSLPNTNLLVDKLTAQYSYENGKLDIGSLKFGGDISRSKICLQDLAFVLPSLNGKDMPTFNVSSSFNGTARRININGLNIRSHDNDIGLTANGFVAKTRRGITWQANIRQLRCSAESIAEILRTQAGKDDGPTKLLERLGNIQYAGSLAGNGGNLTAAGSLASDIGKADIKIGKTGRRISAFVDTDGLDLGRMLDNDKFGMLATTVDVDCLAGNGGLSDIRINGTFPRFDYNGYTYKDITAKGVYDKVSFTGVLNLNDPNAQVALEGKADLSSPVKKADLKATIRNLDLASLNITDKWEETKFDFDINTNVEISDKTPNLFSGDIRIGNFTMRSSEKVYEFDSLDISAGHEHLAAYGDFGHVELNGRYKLKTLANSFANILHSKLPTLFKAHASTDNKFTIDAEIRNTDLLTALTGIPLGVSSPLNVSANVDEANGMISVACRGADIIYDEAPYENVSLMIGTTGDMLSLDGKLRKTMNNGHKVDLTLAANAGNDKLSTSIRWNNNQKKLMAGEMNFKTSFTKNATGKTDIGIDVNPSEILINNTVWNVLPANITYSNGNLSIEDFSIEHNRQHIRIDGLATKHSSDSIAIDLQDVDVSYVLGLINFHSVEFGGHMTGKAYVKSVFYEPDIYADLIIDQFTLQGGSLGTLFAKVGWNKTGKSINIDACAKEDDGSRTIVKGYVSPVNKNIDLGIRAEGTNIEFIENFCGSFMDNIEAKARGEVKLHGPLKAMNLTGKVVADGKLRISPINVTYRLENDTISFTPDNIVFHSDTIRDRNGNIGIVNGKLHHRHLKDMTYDINISTNNLLCYDTKGYGEDSFYGTAYGTGLCTIKGRKGQVNIDIDVTPCKDSFIEYNVTSPDVVSDQQFITWRDMTPAEASKANDSLRISNNGTGDLQWSADEIPSDIRINFIINMTPEATLRVLMDKNTNDYIALNGNGTIRASYFNKGQFNMFGTFVIDHGVYTLTIQNIIKKVFQFQRGSSIVFGGNPYNAMLNLQAIYTVNGVPLSDLQLGNSFSSNNVRVDCLMNISGTPKSPHIDFNIDMPTVNEDAEQMVRTLINSEEEMNQQVVYLLGVGRFYMQGNNNSSEQRQNQTSLAMQSLLSGTISQQINTLLGSIVKNNNWTFGANISTGDEGFNNAEYEGLLSGRLLDNRLIINGQFGYRDNANATTSFIGDFDINYLLKPNGNISLKVYNQTNDRYFTKSSLNTQGIGIMLKKDFNSFIELFGGEKKRKDKK